jgi:hypothetical protein
VVFRVPTVIDEQIDSGELVEAQVDECRLGRQAEAHGNRVRDRLKRASSVGQVPDAGGGDVQAVRPMRREVIDEDFVGDAFDANALAADSGVSGGHRRPGSGGRTVA